ARTAERRRPESDRSPDDAGPGGQPAQTEAPAGVELARRAGAATRLGGIIALITPAIRATGTQVAGVEIADIRATGVQPTSGVAVFFARRTAPDGPHPVIVDPQQRPAAPSGFELHVHPRGVRVPPGVRQPLLHRAQQHD